MQLKIHEVAAIMRVTEGTVRRWIEDDGLPAVRDSGEDYVHRLAFFEWALCHGIDRAAAILSEQTIDSTGHEPLAKAIEAGDVLCDLAAADRESALRSVADRLRLPSGVDRDHVVDLFLSQTFRDAMDLGDGIVVPHPRRPFILHLRAPQVTACHFERPVELNPGDDGAARTLFVIVAPTVGQHLLLLAHLAMLLRDENFRSLVEKCSGREVLAQFVRQNAFQTDSGARGAVHSANVSRTARGH